MNKEQISKKLENLNFPDQFELYKELLSLKLTGVKKKFK